MENPTNPTPPQHQRMSGEKRRAYILEQAKIIFGRQSYMEASTGELARASGVTEPILYKHFGSKKKLYLTMLTSIGEQFLDRFSRMTRERAEKDLRDCLQSILIDYRNAGMADHDSMHILLYASLETKDTEIENITQAHNQKIYEIIFNLLKEAQQQKILAPHLDMAAATWGTLSFLFALQYRAKMNLFDEFNEKTINEINRLWFQSLCTG